MNAHRSKKKLAISAALTVLFITLLLGEGIARLAGFGPWRLPDAGLTLIPGPYAEADSELGYALKEGEFSVRFNDGRSYTATHTGGLRYTGPMADTAQLAYSFGCSYTYGYGINDAETEAYVANQALPRLNIYNYAAPGYCQVQALLQLKQSIAVGNAPSLAIIHYAGFHDARNTLCRYWKKQIAPYNKDDKMGKAVQYPYARFNKSGQLQIGYQPLQYKPWPLQKMSALVHGLEKTYNQQQVKKLESRKVSLALFEQIDSLCDANGIQVLVAGIMNIENEQEVLQHCASLGMDTLDISVDVSQLQYRISESDYHPNATAHQLYAEALIAKLREMGY